MKKLLFCTLLCTVFLVNTVFATPESCLSSYSDFSTTYDKILHQTEGFPWEASKSISKELDKLLQNEDTSFYDYIALFSSKPLYESFTECSNSRLKALLNQCGEKERSVLSHLFYYGTIDYFDIHPISSKRELKQIAEILEKKANVFHAFSEKETEESNLLLLRILNLQKESREYYKDLRLFLEDRGKQNYGKNFLSMLEKKQEKEKLLEDLKVLFSLEEVSSKEEMDSNSTTSSNESEKRKEDLPKIPDKSKKTKGTKRETTRKSKEISTTISETSIPGTSLKIQTASTKDYTKTHIGKDKVYTKGSIKLFLLDENSGEKTTATLHVSRDTAPEWDYMCEKPTKWKCHLDIDSSSNPHHLKMTQTTVTTVKDIYDFYLVMNFKLSITQHSYYIYHNQKHAGSGNGFRLNFASYRSENNGPDTIIDGMVEEDITRTINWQVNSAAIGLKTFEKYKYTNCKSYLNYYRPEHSVSVDPNGGSYLGNKSETIYKNETGRSVRIPAIPIRKGYLYQGFEISGLNYAFRCTGLACSHIHPSSISHSYFSTIPYTRYYCANTKARTSSSISLSNYKVPAGHSIRITGKIRVYKLPNSSSLQLNQQISESKAGNAVVTFDKENKEWQKFDFTQTFLEATNDAFLKISTSYENGSLEFELKDIIITDMTTKKRLADTQVTLANYDVKLKAMWKPLLFQLTFDANGGKGSMSNQVLKQADPTTLPQCTFSKAGYSFQGWQIGDNIYQPGQSISYFDFVKPSLQERKLDADIEKEKVEKEDNLTLVAKWVPSSSSSGGGSTTEIKPENPNTNLSTSDYLEGEIVPISQIWSKIRSEFNAKNPSFDGNIYFSKIVYPSSKDGYQPSSTSSSSGNLNTYAFHLKEGEIVSIPIFYETVQPVYHIIKADPNDKDSKDKVEVSYVTRSYQKNVTVRYNVPPKIKAKNLTFFQSEILENPNEVKRAIEEYPIATDLEDNQMGKTLKAFVQNPNPLDLTKMKNLGSYQLTYQATDSLGKSTKKTIQIYVVDSNPYTHFKDQSIRFISKQYVNTLDNNSIWKSSSEYSSFLHSALEKEDTDSGNTYLFNSGSNEQNK